jgi:hypothetical protein
MWCVWCVILLRRIDLDEKIATTTTLKDQSNQAERYESCVFLLLVTQDTAQFIRGSMMGSGLCWMEVTEGGEEEKRTGTAIEDHVA